MGDLCSQKNLMVQERDICLKREFICALSLSGYRYRYIYTWQYEHMDEIFFLSLFFLAARKILFTVISKQGWETTTMKGQLWHVQISLYKIWACSMPHGPNVLCQGNPDFGLRTSYEKHSVLLHQIS